MPIILKWIESTGKNGEVAIKTALQKLGMGRGKVSVEILERAKSGLLGTGNYPARVRVNHEAPDEPEGRPAPAEITHAEAEPVKMAESATREETPCPAVPAIEGKEVEYIDASLTGLLAQMGAEVRPVTRVNENGTYQAELVGWEPGGLIGCRGEALDVIQQFTGYAVNHGQSKQARIRVDAEGCRAKREEPPVRLAQKVAGKVVKCRRNVTLKPMSVYEHHVIHTVLQETPDTITYSIDIGPNRRMVVVYNRGEHCWLGGRGALRRQL